VRAVIDTNVLLSGLLWHGAPHALIQCVRGGTLTLVSSPELLAELADVVGRAKFDVILAREYAPRTVAGRSAAIGRGNGAIATAAARIA
jgi:putative PIN family toxin of toxin-antitoxin system